MLGERPKQSNIFQMVTMEDLVPENYFYRKVNKIIDFSFIRELVKEKYCSDNGRPSVAPETIIRIMLIGYFENFSDLRLWNELQMHAGYRWFCQLDFNEPVPDRSTWIKTRQRWGTEIFDRIFRQIVEQCIQSGLVKGNMVAIDGTQVEANAAITSMEAITPAISIEEYLNRHQSEESKTNDDKSKKPPRQGGDPNFRGEKFSNQTHRSTTDPDARLYRKNSDHEAKMSYLVHNALDVRSGVILDTEATLAHGRAERETATQFLQRLGSNVFALMDKNYRAGDFLSQICRLGIHPLVPMESLEFEEVPDWKRKTYKLDCQRKRHIRISEAKARNYARLLNRKHVFKKTYKLRIKVEHKFAEAKECHGLDRAKGFGLENMKIQARLTATVQNIKRLVSYRTRSYPKKNVATSDENLLKTCFSVIKVHYDFLNLPGLFRPLKFFC